MTVAASDSVENINFCSNNDVFFKQLAAFHFNCENIQLKQTFYVHFNWTLLSQSSITCEIKVRKQDFVLFPQPQRRYGPPLLRAPSGAAEERRELVKEQS